MALNGPFILEAKGLSLSFGGLEVLRRVKGDQRTRTIPVVILTSSKEERDVMTSYDLGVNSYIVKPVGFDQYMRTVSDVGRYWNDLNQLPQMAP